MVVVVEVVTVEEVGSGLSEFGAAAGEHAERVTEMMTATSVDFLTDGVYPSAARAKGAAITLRGPAGVKHDGQKT